MTLPTIVYVSLNLTVCVVILMNDTSYRYVALSLNCLYILAIFICVERQMVIISRLHTVNMV